MTPDDETPAAEAAPEAPAAEEKPTRLEQPEADTTNNLGERAPNELKQPKEE